MTNTPVIAKRAPTRNGVGGAAVFHAHPNGVRVVMQRSRHAEDARPQRAAKQSRPPQ